jgi:hypothetical protein
LEELLSYVADQVHGRLSVVLGECLDIGIAFAWRVRRPFLQDLYAYIVIKTVPGRC